MATNKSRSKSKMAATTTSRSKASATVAENMVMTRSRSKALMPVKRTARVSTAVTEACIAEANKQMGRKKLKAFYKSKPFVNAVQSTAHDMYLEEDEGVREYVQKLNHGPIADPLVIPKPVEIPTPLCEKLKPVEIPAPLCDAHKRWRAMSDDEKAPWVVKAARKELEDDVAVDVPCYGERGT
ncbi:uncharacterized protein LOC104883576 isoform X2 [Beta vulgaris subsp. vulgaris]|nr:uncharacterized protein LOC104883576 isoform X2 [Beta vulgaris subsp. vulgaris]